MSPSATFCVPITVNALTQNLAKTSSASSSFTFPNGFSPSFTNRSVKDIAFFIPHFSMLPEGLSYIETYLFISSLTCSMPARIPSTRETSSNLSGPPNLPIHELSFFETPSSVTFSVTSGNGATSTLLLALSFELFPIMSGKFCTVTPRLSVVLFEFMMFEAHLDMQYTYVSKCAIITLVIFSTVGGKPMTSSSFFLIILSSAFSCIFLALFSVSVVATSIGVPSTSLSPRSL